MEPNRPQGQTTKPIQPQSADDDKYAQSLAQMATLDYQLEQSKQPETKHFISKKTLIYIALSTIIGIISLIVMSLVNRGGSTLDPSSGSSSQTQELLDGAKQIQDVRNELNE